MGFRIPGEAIDTNKYVCLCLCNPVHLHTIHAKTSKASEIYLNKLLDLSNSIAILV